MPDTLKQRAVSGVFWVGVTGAISRVLSFGTMLVLAKLLTPEELGLVALGWLVTSSTGLFREMGLNRALIYQKENVTEAADTAFYLLPIISVVLYGILFLAAPLLAEFFRESAITQLVRILGLTLVIQSFGEIPAALLEKDIKFKRASLPDTLNLSIYSIGSVILAWYGFSYWSIVIAQLVGELVRLAAVWILSPWRPSFRFHRSAVQNLFAYSKYVFGATIVNFGIRNIDDAAIGRMLGMQVLGIYTTAYRLANLPATNITNVIARVMMPVFTQLSHRTDELSHAFLKTLKHTASVNIPVSLLIVMLTGDFLTTIYQDKWADAIAPLRILCIFGLLRALGSGTGSVFLATGRPAISMKIAGGQFVCMLAFLYPAIHFWGVTGVCWLFTFGAVGSLLASYVAVRRIIPFTWSSLWKTVALPIASASLAGVIVWTVRYWWELTQGLPELALLASLLVVIYLIPLVKFDPEYRELWRTRVLPKLLPSSLR